MASQDTSKKHTNLHTSSHHPSPVSIMSDKGKDTLARPTFKGPNTSSFALMKGLQGTVEELRQIVNCTICFRPMYEPYTTQCGHSFCYSCLVLWFEKNRGNLTCPECRARVKMQPVPSYAIRAMTQLLCQKPELLPDGETSREHEIARQEESLQVDADKEDDAQGGLFRGCFKQRHRHRFPIRDEDDNVDRCPDCNFEISPDGICEGCGMDWASNNSLLDSDESMYIGMPPYRHHHHRRHHRNHHHHHHHHHPRDSDINSADEDDDNGDREAANMFLHNHHLAHFPEEFRFFGHSDSDDYPSEISDPSTDLSGFIENDNSDDNSDDDENHVWPPSSSSTTTAPSLNRQSGSAYPVIDGDVAHYGAADSDISSSASGDNNWNESEPLQPTEIDIGNDTVQFSSDSEGQSSQDGSNTLAVLEDNENPATTDASASDLEPPVNLIDHRSDSRTSRKRRRVIDDEDTEAEGDFDVSRSHSRRRLNHQRAITPVEYGSDMDTQTNTPSSQQLRLRLISRHNCRDPQFHSSRPSWQHTNADLSLRRNLRTFTQISTLRVAFNDDSPGQVSVSTFPPMIHNILNATNQNNELACTSQPNSTRGYYSHNRNVNRGSRSNVSSR